MIPAPSLVERALDRDPLAVDLLLRTVERWIADESPRPLEAYLGMPTTPTARRRQRRDVWLRRAAAECPAAGPWRASEALAAELFAFVTRGPWEAWREAGGPPTTASRLRLALYYVAALNDGEPLSQRQIHDIARDAFPKTPRADAPRLQADPTTGAA